MLFDIYRILYPDTKLSAADMQLYFAVNGLAKEGSIYMDLRAEHITQIPDVLFTRIEAHLTIDTLRKLDMAAKYAVSADPAVAVFEEFRRLFIKVGRAGTRTKLTRMHNLYALYCIDNKHTPIGNKRFAQLVANTVSPVRRGYAEQTSGVNYAMCSIPIDKHWKDSLRLGIGLFESMGKLYDNLGKRIDLENKSEITVASTKMYIENRLRGKAYDQTEEEETLQEEEKFRADDRRTIEGSEETTQGREEEVCTSAGNDTSSESSESPTESSIPRDASSEDSGIDIAEDDIAHTDTEVGSSGIESEPIETTDTGYDGTDDEYDEYYTEEPATLKEIFSALEIVYRINPDTFTKRTMNSYLVSMDVEQCVDDLWDDFMKYIGKDS
jgi:hypothetical protein